MRNYVFVCFMDVIDVFGERAGDYFRLGGQNGILPAGKEIKRDCYIELITSARTVIATGTVSG